MEYRRVGNSGLKVSEIGLGSWLTYGNSVQKDEAVAVIDRAYELGVNLFDTADCYGDAEEVVGPALKRYRRSSYVLATKCFFPQGQGVNERGLSRKHIIESCERSLRRLGLDYVDIFYCHQYDPETPIEETMMAFEDLIRQGKVLYMGVSNWQALHITKACRVADRYLLHKIICNQPPYNMFDRFIEKDIMATSAENGIGQICFSPLAQGMLTGKYTSPDDIPEGSRASQERFNGGITRMFTPDRFEKINAIRRIADGLGIPMAQLALAWVLRQPNVSSALVGATSPSQIEMNVLASGYKLSLDTVAAIEQALKH
ncbi:MAG: aldo/keto reductase family protein [Clostridia bacterium]|nr:aldo/keto reductase family protein [Clostridia bacterium]